MTYLTHADWEALRKAWASGNDEGLGSAFGEGGDTLRRAAKREGYEVVAVSETGSVLAHSRHKHYYLLVADNGPWGVDVTTTARAILGDEVSPHA
jgi:hypothetical protein